MESGRLIAIFCNSFPPEGGGASNRIHNLAVLLRDAGYRVQVICAMPNYPTGKIFPAYRGKVVVDETVAGIAVRRVWMTPSNSAATLARGWSMVSFVISLKLFAFRKVRKMQPSLVIVSSPPLPMAAAAVRYFRKWRCKVLLNVSDIWPLSAVALGATKENWLYKLLQRMERRMYESADAFTAQSEETLAHIHAVAPSEKPTLLLHNLPPDDAAVPQQNLPHMRHGLRIIYPGLLGHAQGILALCRQVDFKVLNASLSLYGDGAEYALIEDWIAQHPDCRVTLSKPVPAAVLTEHLNGYHAVLIPLSTSLQGALPSKLFTAIRAGLPVIFCGGGEGAGIVEKYGLGYTATPGDYSGIGRQIGRLAASDVVQRAAMRRNIKHIAATIFNKEAQDERLRRFIATLLCQ